MSEARDRYNQLFALYKPEENPDAPNWIKVVYNRISELEQQNKYLTEQNKAFQEEYNTSGDIIRELRQQNKELIASFDDFIIIPVKPRPSGRGYKGLKNFKKKCNFLLNFLLIIIIF